MIGLHYDMNAAAYHADPCDPPSLSSSIASIMLLQSPRHAWHAHARLGQKKKNEDSRQMERGTAAHKLILGRGNELEEIAADTYQSKAAKEARSAAIEAGRSPILRHDFDECVALAAAFNDQISQIDGCAGFLNAPSEVVAIVKDETGAMMRAMFDKLEMTEGGAIIWDLKTTGQTAAPQAIGRKIADMDYELQAAFYERVLVTLRPELAGRIIFRWAFIETDAPYALTVAELDNTGLEIGRKKVAAALHLWNRSMAENNWPGYPNRIIRAEYPSYAETRWLQRETDDEQLGDFGRDPFLTRAPWRPPTPPKKLVFGI